MAKIINIDTKTRTIRVENDGKIKAWRTTESGAHFPIKEGESTKEALDKFVGSKRPEAKKEESPAMRAARESSSAFDRLLLGIGDKKNGVKKAQPAKKEASQPTSYDLDDAFEEADLGPEWGRAKHRMDFHGVSQYTIQDIIDSGKYRAGDIIEALESNTHDKIDEMRKAIKEKPAKEEKSDFDEATWAKAYTQAMKKYGPKKGGLNAPTVDEVKAQYDILKKQPAEQESGDLWAKPKSHEGSESFKSAMQETMKSFPRLYDFEKQPLESFAEDIYGKLQENPGKEKEVLKHYADAYKSYMATLGPWVDTPTLVKSAFIKNLLDKSEE